MTLNLLNSKFGKLTVIQKTDKRKQRKIVWLCKCECGKEIEEVSAVLKAGRKTHCGCKNKKSESKPKVKNKPAKSIRTHKYYGRWKNIKRRCYSTNHKDYPNYGGRGISLANEWVNNSIKFCEWLDENLGDCPTGYTLERIDNNKNYEPGNLKWASRKEQNKNRRPYEEWKPYSEWDIN